MPRCRVVAPDTLTLPISDGDWLLVKKILNAGESRNILTMLVKEQHFGQAALVNVERVGLTKLVEYIVDWSLIDANGKKLPVGTSGEREASLKSLDLDSYNEIDRAVDAHEAAMEQELAARKNGSGGESASSAISSPAA